jgi:hypothetical protein
MTRVALVLAAITTLGLGVERADAAIAIAFNPSSGKAAAYNGSWDLDAAKKVALSNCGSGCRIVASGKKTCAAVVEAVSTGTYAWAVAYGSTTGTAANSGWHECRRKGGVQCKTAAAICD